MCLRTRVNLRLKTIRSRTKVDFYNQTISKLRFAIRFDFVVSFGIYLSQFCAATWNSKPWFIHCIFTRTKNEHLRMTSFEELALKYFLFCRPSAHTTKSILLFLWLFRFDSVRILRFIIPFNKAASGVNVYFLDIEFDRVRSTIEIWDHLISNEYVTKY